MGFIGGIIIGAIGGAILTFFIIRNNKELIKSWIDKIPNK